LPAVSQLVTCLLLEGTVRWRNSCDGTQKNSNWTLCFKCSL